MVGVGGEGFRGGEALLSRFSKAATRLRRATNALEDSESGGAGDSIVLIFQRIEGFYNFVQTNSMEVKAVGACVFHGGEVVHLVAKDLVI